MVTLYLTCAMATVSCQERPLRDCLPAVRSTQQLLGPNTRGKGKFLACGWLSLSLKTKPRLLSVACKGLFSLVASQRLHKSLLAHQVQVHRCPSGALCTHLGTSAVTDSSLGDGRSSSGTCSKSSPTPLRSPVSSRAYSYKFRGRASFTGQRLCPLRSPPCPRALGMASSLGHFSECESKRQRWGCAQPYRRRLRSAQLTLLGRKVFRGNFNWAQPGNRSEIGHSRVNGASSHVFFFGTLAIVLNCRSRIVDRGIWQCHVYRGEKSGFQVGGYCKCHHVNWPEI